MTTKNLRVAHSPLTGTIYCGHVLKDGRTWAANKTDVTSDVLGAVIEKIGAGETIVVRANGVPKYEISVKAIQGEPS